MPKRDTVRRINNAQAKPATRTVGSLKSVTQPPSPSRDLGGWAVGERTISAGDLLLHADGFIRVGQGDDVAVMSVLDELYRFWAGSETPGSAPYRVTRTGHVTMDDATVKGHIEALTGELHELTVKDRITIGVGGEIVSEDYAAGVSGIRLAPTGQSEMLDLLVRGTLRTVVFEKNYISTVGGTLRVEEEPSAGTVAEPFTVPAVGYANGITVYFEEEFGFVAAADDRVAFTDPSTGKYGILVFIGVVGLPYGGHLFYNNGEATPGDVFAAGSLAYNLEYESEGYLLLTANPVLKGPRYAVVDTSTGIEKLVGVFGNLDGSYGVSGGGAKVFGIGAGDYVGGNYLLYEPTGGFRIHAGGEAVTLDEEGLRFDAGHAQEAYRMIRWYANDYAGRDIRQYPGAPTGYAEVVRTSATLGSAGFQIMAPTFQRDVLGVGWTTDALPINLIAGAPGGGYSQLQLYMDDNGDGTHSIILTPSSSKRILLNGDVALRGIMRESTPLGCVVYRDSAQSINNNSLTTLTPNTEQHDFGDCWASGNPERFVAPEAGYYSMSAHLEWANPGNNAGSREIIIQHRDVTPTFQRNVAWQKVTAIANTEMQQSVSVDRVYMTGGTYLIVVVRQSSGAALNVAAATADAIYKHSMRFARVA